MILYFISPYSIIVNFNISKISPKKDGHRNYLTFEKTG